MAWVIVNTQDRDLCWSNSDGWCEDNYDTFSDEEKEHLPLPMGGEWEKVPWFKQES